MIKDSSFDDIKKYKKYRDLYDKKSIEFFVSLVSAIIVTILLTIIIKQTNIDDANSIIRSLTKDIAIALIGLLGFVVTGLAILTSAISNKLMNIMYQKGKVDHIKKILLSFYLLSFCIGVCILLDIFFYIISFCNSSINMYVFAIVTFICTYLSVFIIFYSIALVGNCVQIFSIINSPIVLETKLSKEEKEIFDSFRITTIEKIVFLMDTLDPKSRINMYRSTMIQLIDNNFDDDIKKAKMKKYLYEHIGRDNKE